MRKKPPVYEFRPWPVGEERLAQKVADVLAGADRIGDHFEGPWLRWNGSKWIDDDGEWGLAFISALGHGAPYALGVDVCGRDNIVWAWRSATRMYDQPHHSSMGYGQRNPWHYELIPGTKGWGRYVSDWQSDHDNARAFRRAMNECAHRRGCANGRGPHLTHPTDPWIRTGNVRNRETGELLLPPTTLTCMYGCPTITPADAWQE